MTDEAPGRTRVESWKEIAAFFGRDERTVKRWEKTRRLPVYRLPGAKSGVFAYSEELFRWLNSRPNQASAPTESEDGQLQAAASPVPPSSLPASPLQRLPSLVARSRPRRRELLWMAPLLALLLILVLESHRLHSLRRAAETASASATAPHTPARSASPASDLYLRGRYYWNHRTDGTLRQAVDAFSEAVVRDPNYAPAYAGLADSYALMPEYAGMPGEKAFPTAIAAARKAVSLDDSLAEAHRALGYALFFWDWDADQAFREFRRASQLDPSDEDVHAWFAHALFNLGRYSEARDEIERARQIEPRSRSVLATQGLIRYWAGEHYPGIAQLQELETSEPDFSAPPRYLALIYFHERNDPDYIEQMKRVAALSPNPDDAALASAAAAGWNHGASKGMLEAMRLVYLRSFKAGTSSGYDLALVCARLNRRQDADHYLDAAFQARDHHVMEVLHGDLDADMRGDLRFEQLKRAIRRRIKFPANEN